MITRILKLFSKQPSGVQPIVLVALGDRKKTPLLFACPTCGRTHSVKGVDIEVARDLAVNCTLCNPKHYACDLCGCETPAYWTRCSSCRQTAKIEAAAEVPDTGGPYFAFGDETMLWEMDQAQTDGLEWVCPTTESYPRIDLDSVLENLTDDMFEDASVDDLDGVAELSAAVDAFNAAQKTITYWADEKRKIKVPPRPAEEAEVAA